MHAHCKRCKQYNLLKDVEENNTHSEKQKYNNGKENYDKVETICYIAEKQGTTYLNAPN